jgi:hypothetical protein
VLQTIFGLAEGTDTSPGRWSTFMITLALVTLHGHDSHQMRDRVRPNLGARIAGDRPRRRRGVTLHSHLSPALPAKTVEPLAIEAVCLWKGETSESLTQFILPGPGWTLGREVMLLPIPVDIARADEPLELFWRQLFTSELPFQLSNDLVHAATLP